MRPPFFFFETFTIIELLNSNIFMKGQMKMILRYYDDFEGKLEKLKKKETMHHIIALANTTIEGVYLGHLCNKKKMNVKDALIVLTLTMGACYHAMSSIYDNQARKIFTRLRNADVPEEDLMD